MENNLYVNTHLENKGKVFQKGSGNKGKGKPDKSMVVCYYYKNEGHSRKTTIRGNKIGRKMKEK